MSAVCWDTVEQRVLVGTAANEVLRVQLQTERATILTQGHAGGRSPLFRATPQGQAASDDDAHEWCQLRALAEHPRQPRYVTAGDDRTVKVWTLQSHRLHCARRLQSAARCAAYSPDGAHLALGCSDGQLVVLIADSLGLLLQRRGGNSSLSGQRRLEVGSGFNSLAYSPDGRLLAMGDAQGLISLFAVHGVDGSPEHSYLLAAVCERHTGPLTHVEWSTDSSCLRSNCSMLELRFWDCEGDQMHPEEQHARLRSLEWTGGCLYSRETSGIHGVDADGNSDRDMRVRTVSVSHSTSAIDKLLVSGDEFQQVKLSRYPCVTPPGAQDHSAGRSSMGHASALTALRFSFNDRYVMSAGGEDLCIFVWRVRSGLLPSSPGSPVPTGAPHDGEDPEEGEDDEEDDSDVEGSTAGEMLFKDKAPNDMPEEEDDVFVVEDPSTGEQLGAVQPWRAAIFAPSNAEAKARGSPPDDTLELRWVYGFRGFDTRRAAFWTGKGQRVVYPAAAVVVVYDPESHSQTYFRQHTDDVLGIAVHR